MWAVSLAYLSASVAGQRSAGIISKPFTEAAQAIETAPRGYATKPTCVGSPPPKRERRARRGWGVPEEGRGGGRAAPRRGFNRQPVFYLALPAARTSVDGLRPLW